MPPHRATIRLLILTAIIWPAVPARADLAVMTDGRVLRVSEVRPLGDSGWLLTLPGGGEISCPRARLREVRPEPPAAVPARVAAEAWHALAGGLVPHIERVAAEHGLEPALVAAVIQAESNFDPRAVSPKGALGLMQLMPATAKELEVADPYDPVENLRGGTAYLARMLVRFDGELDLALAAYNAGPSVVERHGGVPPYPETRTYVRRVLAQYGRL